MTCTEHLSCRLAGKREADAYTEERTSPTGETYFAVMVGTDEIAQLSAPAGRFGRWQASAGGNSVGLSTVGEKEFYQATREVTNATFNSAFHMRMAIHG